MKKKGLAAIIGGGIVALAGITGVVLGIRKNKTEGIACGDEETIADDPDFEIVEDSDEE